MNFKTLIDSYKEIVSQGKISNIIRVVKKALESYGRANSGLWVTSLCFYTILSLVPIFAILFSLGTWLGVADYFLVKLRDYSPLNEESINLLITFAQNFLENTRTGILAGIGFLFLGWTLISMFSIIEKAFNDIWRVEKSRMFLRKITDYISFFILFPTLLVISSGVVKIIADKVGLENIALSILIKLIPFLTLLFFFTTMYMLIPNTKVRFIPALIAAVFISLFFSGFQSLFILLQGMVNTYNKIYGSFSVIFIFLFWLKLMWFFIILGAHLCYFLQNRELHLFTKSVEDVNFKIKEYTAVILMKELVERYLNSLTPLTINEIIKKYGIPYEVIKYILNVFIENELVGEIGEKDDKSYVIIKNVDGISFKTVFKSLENFGERISIENSEEIEKLLECVRDKNFKFSFKEYIEKN
ncbi:MAG: YihY/virulence factor BrkB family protein [Candidatus Fusobacterium pullicola]|uniref:YihY/virulence factor BrkB family protein n=2 Tax=Fusobacterium TaxID=848 RepID=A0A9E2NW94_9FUSO|nr:YihY/virulence factor BrkB family protein [Fusobacterium mortiferum]MBU3841408.1 YihY/virulence factor BrkB family protein [Candidatus Fusobacterium pullicola]